MNLFDLFFSYAIVCFFIVAGVVSLRLIFNEQFRRWFLSKTRRHTIEKAAFVKAPKLSKAKLAVRTEEGSLLAGAVLVALIFLPVGVLGLIVLIVETVSRLF